ncbi:MAG TPA: CDP-alcohol phosphatidyltransferase family protein [Candidatus Limnocylindria bacterium]|nr:CDP-alcohol phosphatidyltransferase family protein [Candidatus Limnocylindria bacterium]
MAADLLSLLRLGLALVLPFALVRGGGVPALIWIAGAVTDYLDGPLARRAGTAGPRGMALDSTADIAFVLGGLATAAALGIVPWLVPLAVLLAVVDYGRAALEVRHGVVDARVVRSRVGHAAGVVNWACLGLVCGRMAAAELVPATVLGAAELATIVTNVGAVVERVVLRSRRP